MPEISFYHLTKSPLEKALPQLLEKVIQSQSRAVVLMKDDSLLKAVDKFLWSYKPESFLPHGSKSDGNEDKQPIYLTTTEENPNGAVFLVNLQGSDPEFIDEFDRVLDIFDGDSGDEVQAARIRWKKYKESANNNLVYWKQDEKGRWQKAG